LKKENKFWWKKVGKMENGESEIILLKDKDWSTIDGEPCLVNYFNPLGSFVGANGKVDSVDKITPYAVIHIECKKLGKNIRGYISHKIDFMNLWKAFKDRELKVDEEVIIMWSKKHYKPRVSLFSSFMPKLWVMIFRKGYYKMVTEPDKNKGFDTLESMLPIKKWIPDGMEY
jgi:hypothetical protein